MTITDQNRALWEELYRLAVEFRDLKPWEWLYDTDIFAVADPQTGMRQYCCIMGNAGEVFALAAYPGPEGLASYEALLNMDEQSAGIEESLEQRCLMVSFENRDDLADPDRNQIKDLGLKFRGAKNWVQFRRYDPGLMPWFISEEEARQLTDVIRQAIIVTKQLREDYDNFVEEERCLVRQLTAEGEWESTWETWPDTPEAAPLVADLKRVTRLKSKLPREEGALLLGMTYMPGGVLDEEGPRPFFARIAMWLHYPSGQILDQVLFQPGELETKFADWFLDFFEQLEVLPRQIGVNSQRLFNLLENLTTALDIELLYLPDEPLFDEIFSFIMGFMGDEEDMF